MLDQKFKKHRHIIEPPQMLGKNKCMNISWTALEGTFRGELKYQSLEDCPSS